MDESPHSGGLEIGTEIEGRYRIDAVLGAGGAGAVYRATHLKLDRPVALKVIREQHGSEEAVRLRFEREARAMATLSHPHVITVTDYGFADSKPYLAMELLEGETLSERLSRGMLDAEDAVDVLAQLLRALAFVHEQGLVHRDLKPGNVFLQSVPGARPHVKLLDFGLAKFMDPDDSEEHSVTRAGEIFGSPSYMAPEQVSSEPTDPRTDLYAAGILLFEMLAGRPPFEGTIQAVLRQHLARPLPTLQEICPGRVASPELDALIRRAAAKEMDARFPTAQDMADRLDALPRPLLVASDARLPLSRPPPPMPRGPDEDSMLAASAQPRSPERKPRMALVGLGAALVGAVVAALFVYGRTSPPTDATASAHRGTSAAAPTVSAATAQAAPTPSAAETPPASAHPATIASPPDLDEAHIWGEVPAKLREALATVDAGEPLSAADVKYIHDYDARHAGDPRGHVVLARSHMNHNWAKDALAEYAGAIRLNPDIRADPRVLDDLLTLVTQGWHASSDLVEREYGPLALPAIAGRLEKVGMDRIAESRLERLRERINGGAPKE